MVEQQTQTQQVSAERVVQALENAVRATSDSANRFIEPTAGVLSQVKSRRHYIIYGRRGSGKSSLLYRLELDASAERQPCALVDLEAVKGLEYPDVLIVVLQRTLKAFGDWLDGAARARRTSPFWGRRGIKTGNLRAPLPKREAEKLKDRVRTEIEALDKLLSQPLSADVVSMDGSGSQTSLGAGLSGGGVDFNAAAAHSQNQSLQLNFRSEKVQQLNRALIRHQDLLRDLSALADLPTLILLDDLYHVPQSSQPYVLDYFHRLCKNLPIYLKVGTIRNRSRVYKGGDPPIGIEHPHDAGSIDLDKTLADFQAAKAFLLDVADGVLQSADVRSRQILKSRVVNRLVLASGGVARDFLNLLGAAVQLAQTERPHVSLTVNIAEVNTVAGDLETSKRADLARDIAEGDDEGLLLLALDQIRTFCYTQKVNCLLLEQDAPTAKTSPVHELVDMRLIHSVRPRVTIPARPGRIYEAYMLDISQWTGQRKRRNLEEIEFWSAAGAEKLRQVRLIYAGRE